MHNYETSESNRDKWEFEYSAMKILEAAQQRSRERQERVEYWTKKKEEVMAKVRESGNTNYGVGGAKVLVDSTLQSDLNECVERIATHRTAVFNYAGWIAVLTANASATLKLNFGDWMYFFGTLELLKQT